MMCVRSGFQLSAEFHSNELQRDLDRVVDWAEKWQASFNVKKCKVLHFGKNNPGYQYSMRDPLSPNRLTLESTVMERDLGILISHNLKWEQQVSKSARTAQFVLAQIKNSFTCLEPEINTTLSRTC